jgi:hypothetical protein
VEGEERKDDTRRLGTSGWKNDTTEKGGPKLVNCIAVWGTRDSTSAVDLGASIVAAGELHMGARTPPLRLKVERQGGSDLIFTAVDPGARIWAVGELHPRTRTPPPSLKDRKARGVRLLLCTVDLGAQIRTARSCLLLTLGASSPETLDKWVLTHSLISKPPKREISLTSDLFLRIVRKASL